MNIPKGFGRKLSTRASNVVKRGIIYDYFPYVELINAYSILKNCGTLTAFEIVCHISGKSPKRVLKEMRRKSRMSLRRESPPYNLNAILEKKWGKK